MLVERKPAIKWFSYQKALAVIMVLSFAVSPFGAIEATALAAPDLVAPMNGSTITSATEPPLGMPVFEWTPVEGAVQYQLQVSASPGFSTVNINISTASTRYVPTLQLLNDGIWYWHVCVSSPAPCAYSDTWQFTKDWAAPANLPILLSPDNGATVDFFDEPMFSWEPVSGAANYKIEIASSPDFVAGTVRVTQTTIATTYQPLDKLASGIYYWRVTPLDPINQYGTISEVRTFNSAFNHIPQLIEPAHNSYPTFTPTFRWEAVVGAKYYRLQYSTAADFSANLTQVDTENTSYTPISALPNDQNYYWRVATNHGPAASLSGWSEVRVFRKQWYLKPTLLTPTNGFQRVRFPFFSWTPVAGASYYKIDIDDDPGFVSPYETGTTSNPFYTTSKYQSLLPAGELFYWRVTPYDHRNNKGVSSNSFSFRSTATNMAPELIYPFYYYEPNPDLNPEENRTASLPLLLWNRVYSPYDGSTWADQYRVRIATDPNFSNTVWWTFTENLGAAPTTGNPFVPVVGQDYYWQVTPADGAGNLLIHESQTWRARFDPSLWLDSGVATPGDQPPQPIRPRNGLEHIEMTPVMEWKPVEGATSYEVEVSRDIGFTQIVLSEEVSYPVYAPTTVLAQRNLFDYDYGTYYWRVHALQNDIPMSGGWNAGQRFQVASQATWRYSRGIGDPANQLQVASDAYGDVGADYDLTSLDITQDKDYWYIGFPVDANTTNTDYLVFIDLDHVDGSGATTDPLSLGISTINSHQPEYVVHVDQTNNEYTPDHTNIYLWNAAAGSYDPYQVLSTAGGDLFAGDLYGVAYMDDTNAWAVGEDGTILFWNGSWWSNEFRPTLNTLIDVETLSPDLAWAVGQNGSIVRWQNYYWQPVTSPTTRTLWDVDFVTPQKGWAASSSTGSTGYMLFWNGTTWSNRGIAGANDLYAVDMITSTVTISNNFGLAVGAFGTWVKWDHATSNWILQSPFTAESLNAVSIINDNLAWAASSHGGIFRWNGVNWTTVRSPNAGLPDLYDIQMLSATDGMAVGNDGVLLRWNGSTWSPVTTNTMLNLYGLDFNPSGSEALVVGESGKNLRWDTVNTSILESAIAGYLELQLPNTTIGMGPTTGSMSVAVVSLNGSNNSLQDTVPSNPTANYLEYLTSASERMNLRTPPDTAIYGSTPSDPRTHASHPPFFYDYPVESLFAGNYIEVHQDPQFTSLVGSSEYTGNPAYYTQSQEAWSVDLPDNTYFWRVRQKYYANNVYFGGVWSQGSSFKREGLVPTNLQTSVSFATPTFSWDRVEGTHLYHFIISANPDFSSPLVNITTPENRYTPTITFAHNASYYWKVYIDRYGGTINTEYASQQFTLHLPQVTGMRHVPAAPPSGSHKYFPTLCWDPLLLSDGTGTPVLAAWKYRVEVSDTTEFTLRLDGADTEQHCWTSILSFADDDFYWRIAMIDGEGKVGPWSAPTHINKLYPAPTLVSPVSGSQATTTPMFIWTPVDGAVQYVLQVAYDELFSQMAFGQVITYNVKYMHIAKLMPGKAYFWRVAMIDRGGHRGPFSDAKIDIGSSLFLPMIIR